ncbi:transient receptor potential cation channel subfamily V member 5-like [Pecten maximus]|uniref:transient receptor potential cation channel subfamily V member 5-like n=1 Tax=Pecten maximus TaxID=6579 RepID=UPI001458C4CD|nr:transient receptor potential cation channel subfamily V member 5-like [Pecten maximus]
MLKKKKVSVQVPLDTKEIQGNVTEIVLPTPKRTGLQADIDNIYRLINNRNFPLARDQLRNFDKDIYGEAFLRWRRLKDQVETDETLLHACLMRASEDTFACITHILDICPDLIMVPRKNKQFAGQTPLHLAIVTGKIRACEEILNVAERSKVKLRLLMNARATGKIFNNSIMMGQIPLFVGALTFKEGIVDLLLRRGASLFVRNGKGDNVFHTIVKYVVINRSKTADARRMITFLHRKVVAENQKKHSKRKQRLNGRTAKKGGRIETSFEKGLDVEKPEKTGTDRKDLRHIWYMKNNNNLTPLQLAAKYGLVEIFIQILNLPDVYCFEQNNDGLFDEKYYDITEVDSITSYKSQLLSGKHKEIPFNYRNVKAESVFQMMFGSKMKSEDIVEITEIPPLRGLIQLKWELYRKTFFIWMITHLIFIIMLSAYTVTLSELRFRPTNSSSTSYTHKENYVNFFTWISFLGGLFYVVLGVTAIIPKFLQPNRMLYWKCNMDYISILTVCGVCLLADVIWQLIDYNHNRLPLLIAVLTGWWFNLFFLRGLKMFSFFTVMIKRVIFGDFLRFSVIIAFQLVSFSASVHMMYQGKNVPSIDSSEDDPSYSKSFDTSMFTMFNLMLGIGGINSPKVSRMTWMTNSLYVLYIFSTYILLVNALIAMMSSTCSFILQNKYSQWRIQQLSVILLLENFLHVILNLYDPVTGSEIIEKQTKRMYDPVTKICTMQIRYFLDMKTLQNDMIEMTAENIEEVTEVTQKRNQESLNNNINKNILKRMAASAFLLPFARQQQQSQLVKPKEDQDFEPNTTYLDPRPQVPAIFYEYLEGDRYYDSHDDRMNEESMRETAKAVFQQGRRGTVVEQFEVSSSDESDESIVVYDI